MPSEDSLDDDGEPIYCVFSEELDAVTFVDAEELSVLRREASKRSIAFQPDGAARRGVTIRAPIRPPGAYNPRISRPRSARHRGDLGDVGQRRVPSAR